jgi:hypothetical protein
MSKWFFILADNPGSPVQVEFRMKAELILYMSTVESCPAPRGWYMKMYCFEANAGKQKLSPKKIF